MDADSPFADLLKTTYDECFTEAQTAVNLEEQDAIAAADQRWRAVVGRIQYLRSLLPQGHTFRREVDQSAMKGLRELELTAHEHLDLHEGLRLSLQSLKLQHADPDPNRSRTSNQDDQDDGLAYGERFPSPTRPPLPRRRSPSPGYSNVAVADSRSSSDSDAFPQRGNVTVPSSSSNTKHIQPPPVMDKKSDRSGSPGKHKFRTTLRTGKPGLRPRNSGPTAPGADSAAAAAWNSKDARVHLERAPLSDGAINVAAAGARTQAHLSSSQAASEKYSLRFDRHTRRLVPKEKPRLSERSDSTEAAGFAAAATWNATASQKEASGQKSSTDPETGRLATNLARQAAKRSGNAISTPKAGLSQECTRTHLGTGVGTAVSRPSAANSRQERQLKEEPMIAASNGIRSRGRSQQDRQIFSETEDTRAEPQDPATMDWEAKRAWAIQNLPPGVEEQTAAQILDEIDPEKDVVRWKDIAGLDEAINALKEAVVYPFLRPDLFKGLREPPRGILLFGPPGTGKTMLARAVATESESTFIAVTASTLNSKYLGESEKHVRALFTIAKMLAPSIIFIDEVDSVLSKRSSSGEHEASRRLKTEFLIQWSSLEKQNAAIKQLNGGDSGDNRVLVLAATNRPWDLDDAATRRFARRQYIPLPEERTRRVQLCKLLESELKHCLTEADIEELVRLTEGYSGSDITHLARQASYGPLRSHGEAVLRMTSDEIRPIEMSDFVACLRTVRPSVNQSSLKQFEDWAREFGETIG